MCRARRDATPFSLRERTQSDIKHRSTRRAHVCAPPDSIASRAGLTHHSSPLSLPPPARFASLGGFVARGARARPPRRRACASTADRICRIGRIGGLDSSPAAGTRREPQMVLFLEVPGDCPQNLSASGATAATGASACARRRVEERGCAARAERQPSRRERRSRAEAPRVVLYLPRVLAGRACDM